jgi:hypothetical protein
MKPNLLFSTDVPIKGLGVSVVHGPGPVDDARPREDDPVGLDSRSTGSTAPSSVKTRTRSPSISIDRTIDPSPGNGVGHQLVGQQGQDFGTIAGQPHQRIPSADRGRPTDSEPRGRGRTNSATDTFLPLERYCQPMLLVP